jgi:hypothetical protein
MTRLYDLYEHMALSVCKQEIILESYICLYMCR